MIDKAIWDDQAEFNAQIHPLPETHVERVAMTKEFTLHLMTELAEFLSAANAFGAHRRPDDELLINHPNIQRQLIDIEKYWMSLCQIWGYTPEQMADTYWKKTATVRQRHTAEWLTQLTGPVVLLDLDGVLADYLTGIRDWIIGGYKDTRIHAPLKAAFKRIEQTREVINAQSLGISIPEWERINHEFRTRGGFSKLPTMPYACNFVNWCRNTLNCQVVAITSRAIDKYPNIYDDTVQWFTTTQMRVDKIWWGVNKAEKLASVKHLIPDIRFAVDDDPRYVQQFAEYGISRVYWYNHGGHAPNPDWNNFKHTHILGIPNLNAIIELETKWYKGV